MVVIIVMFLLFNKLYDKKSGSWIVFGINTLVFLIFIFGIYILAFFSPDSELNNDHSLVIKKIEKNPLYFDCDELYHFKNPGHRIKTMEAFCENIVNRQLLDFIENPERCEKKVKKNVFEDVISCQKEVLRLREERFNCDLVLPNKRTLCRSYDPCCHNYFVFSIENYSKSTGLVYGSDAVVDFSNVCYDSDGGLELGIKGFVSFYGVEFHDVCHSETILYEMICKDDLLMIKTFDCVCENGACLSFD